MKRSTISLLVAGLFAGTAVTALAADDSTSTDIKATPKQVETSQSRSSDPNTREAANDTSKDAKQDKNTAGDKNHDKTAADFRKADRDNDGTLDRKEATKMHGNVGKNFDAIDADKDGTISMEELDTFMAAHPGQKGDM